MYVGYFRFEVFDLVFDYLVWVRYLGWWFGLLRVCVVCFIGSGFSGLVDLVCLFDFVWMLNCSVWCFVSLVYDLLIVWFWC